jgi:FkbM family methyltransferase
MTRSSPFYSPPSNCQVPQLGEKWELIFGRRTEGFFVEVGAYDGENFSNTSCLADAGWAGLYIEPIEEFAEKCRLRHARNPGVSVLNCAASDNGGTAEIFIGDTLTTLVGDQVADYEKIDWARGLHRGERREVRTARLDSILGDQNAPIGFDVLVVDVEGAEEKVIDGFDIERWRPKVILIELEDEHPDFRNNARVVQSVVKIRQKIEGAGYSLYFKDQINSLYVRSDVAQRVVQRPSRPSDEPQVSIGLPTYNRVDMLREAVRSIRSQTFDNFELVISDNCSPDPEVAELCIALSESDARIAYVRQSENIGAANNFLAVFEMSKTDLFMWASDDDQWDETFLEQAVQALDADSSVSAWMCHVSAIDATGAVVRELPNLSRFSSTNLKYVDLARFIAQPECLGKANLFHSVFRRTALAETLRKARPYFHDWGFDMILIYTFLCRSNIKVAPDVRFYKRLAANEVGFVPDDPRKYIVPWAQAGRYYGALVDLSQGTPFHWFTQGAVRMRFLYDAMYWRLKLKQYAPWRPSQGAS